MRSTPIEIVQTSTSSSLRGHVFIRPAAECGKRTYVFGDVSDSSHAQDGDPDGTDRPEKVAVLQGVVIHNAPNGHAWLVTRVIELQETRKTNSFFTLPLQTSMFFGHPIIS